MKKLTILLLFYLITYHQTFAHELNYKCRSTYNLYGFENSKLFQDIFIELNSSKKKAKVIINNKNHNINYKYDIPKISLEKINLDYQLLDYSSICKCKTFFSVNLEIDRLTSIAEMRLTAFNSEITSFNKKNLRKRNLERCYSENEIIKTIRSLREQTGKKQTDGKGNILPELIDCSSEDILMPKQYDSKSPYIDVNICKRYCYNNHQTKLSCKKF